MCSFSHMPLKVPSARMDISGTHKLVVRPISPPAAGTADWTLAKSKTICPLIVAIVVGDGIIGTVAVTPDDDMV